jgi:hypothetical protein
VNDNEIARCSLIASDMRACVWTAMPRIAGVDRYRSPVQRSMTLPLWTESTITACLRMLPIESLDPRPEYVLWSWPDAFSAPCIIIRFGRSRHSHTRVILRLLHQLDHTITSILGLHHSWESPADDLDAGDRPLPLHPAPPLHTKPRAPKAHKSTDVAQPSENRNTPILLLPLRLYKIQKLPGNWHTDKQSQ